MTYYRLEVLSSTKKADIWRALTKYLVDEETALEDEENLSELELRRQELQ